MKKKLLYLATMAAACIALVLLPCLGFWEAQHQAYVTQAGFALGYAREVRYSADELGRQAEQAIELLARSRYAPCSDEARILMRDIDLTSAYLQAIGYVQDDTLVCSSLGDIPTPLGKTSFTTSTGIKLYLDVPVGEHTRTVLMAIERNGIAVLVHRDLPLANWTAISGVSVAVVHLERPAYAKPAISRGFIETGWVSRLGTDREKVFIDKGHLVAMVRLTRIPSVAIAAIPVSNIEQQAFSIAARLVPAGFLTGLAVAVLLFLLARRQKSVISALRYALRHDEFFLLYQPLVDLKTGKCVGVEALLRLRRDTGEVIGPDLFIPIAEQGGLITRLTERVIELIEKDAGDFLAQHEDFHVAFNISPQDLQSDRAMFAINGLLERTSSKPSNIIIEITERGFIDVALANQAISELRGQGIRIALDDFGTGYSSLSYLECLEVDYLKIDRTFIQTIGAGTPTNQVIVHIIAMAKSIGLRTIAEGIETEEQAAFIRAHDVDFAQGWLFGRPAPFSEIRALLNERMSNSASPARLAV